MIAKAYNHRISILHPEEYEVELMRVIPLVAKNYGARFDIDEHLVNECCEIFETHFKALSVQEISFAYQLWTSQEFNLNGAEMYGGEFSAAQFSRVLSAYKKHRQKIVAELLNLQDIEDKKEKVEAAKLAAKKNYLDGFEDFVKSKIEKIESWQYVPADWFDTMRTKGWIKITREEALEIFAESKKYAERDMILEKKFLTELDFEAKQKLIAQKITVYRKYIKPFFITKAVEDCAAFIKII